MNTPQQVVVKEKTVIRIVPAEREYLYVPQYDPEIVYVQPYSQDYGPLVTFGVGFAVGSWLNYDFDWNRHQIYRGDWQPGWNYSGYGNGGNGGGNNIINVVNIAQNTAQPWQASSRSRQQLARQQQNFQANSNNFGNAPAASGVTVAAANNAGQQIRQVPKPSRANFGNRGEGNRAPQQPSATSTQPLPGATTAIQTTTPPNVAGQQGKPLRNRDNPNAGQNVNKHGQQPGKNAGQLVPSTVQSPQNPAPGEIGTVPSTSPSKKQRGANLATSGRVPQTTQAPSVDQNGRTQPAASQPATGGKHHQRAGSVPQTQTAPPANPAALPSSAPSGKNSSHKNNNADRLSVPPAQTQSSQSAPGNKHQQQKPQVQSNQPQQPTQAPKKHGSDSKASNPAPQQQQKQKPQQQQQQPKQQQPAKHQEQKAAPAAKQNQAPAAAKPAQNASAGKKSDKKKDSDNGH